MIRLIDGLPNNVIDFEAVGEVRAGDYKSVLKPALESSLERNEKARFLYVPGHEFDGYSGGATWEDIEVGVSHWARCEKIAVVTDRDAYADGDKAFGWMISRGIKTLSLDELPSVESCIFS